MATVSWHDKLLGTRKIIWAGMSTYSSTPTWDEINNADSGGLNQVLAVLKRLRDQKGLSTTIPAYNTGGMWSAAEITNIRNAINTVRQSCGAAAYSFTSSLAGRCLFDNLDELRKSLGEYKTRQKYASVIKTQWGLDKHTVCRKIDDVWTYETTNGNNGSLTRVGYDYTSTLRHRFAGRLSQSARVNEPSDYLSTVSCKGTYGVTCDYNDIVTVTGLGSGVYGPGSFSDEQNISDSFPIIVSGSASSMMNEEWLGYADIPYYTPTTAYENNYYCGISLYYNAWYVEWYS
jgi:hypothetical protein